MFRFRYKNDEKNNLPKTFTETDWDFDRSNSMRMHNPHTNSS